MNNVDYLKQNGVDVEHGLELLGDMETYNSIMEDFYNAYSERMDRINNYKNSGDMANYAIEVHSLKSDSKYLGFMSLADIAYSHEMASKASDSTTVNNTYAQLVNEANKVIEIVKVYLGKGMQIPKQPNVDPIPEVHPENVIPAQETPGVVIPEVVVSENAGNMGKKILVADDSNIIRDFVNEIFSGEYQVLTASNGDEVINILNNNNDISVLLLDLNMPGKDGFEVLQYLKDYDLFKKLNVSIISGANDKESIDKAFTYPIVDMLNKPFSKDTVKMVVEKTINYNVR